jgi:cortactin
MQKLREETALSDAQIKQKQLNEGPKAAFGYGGKFGVQEDRYAYINYSYPAFTK